MYNLEFSQVFKSIEQLDSKPSYEIVIESIEVVNLQKFEQIHA
jgi:hypothetical protein